MRQRPQRPLAGFRDPRRPGRAKHGASVEELALLLRAQGGKCPGCGANITAVGAAVVDHDHRLARLHPHPVARGCALCRRGLTCSRCNTAIGYALDSPATLRRLAAYLERWAS